MPSLQVRDMPDNLYHLLQKRAKTEHRSLAQEAVIVLAKGLDTSVSQQDRRKKLLATIKNNPIKIMAVNAPDPVDLIREDRDR